MHPATRCYYTVVSNGLIVSRRRYVGIGPYTGDFLPRPKCGTFTARANRLACYGNGR
jgi:hypothetical protein